MSSALIESQAPINNLPQVLINKYTDEEQNLKIISERLQPSQSSQNMVVFEIPKKGTVMDSNSAFVVRVGWGGYDPDEDDQETVCPKIWSGVLTSLERAILYVDGKKILFQEGLGNKLWLEHRFQNPDQISEIGDIQHGSNNACFVKQSYATAQVNTSGKVQLKRTKSNGDATSGKSFNNKIGSDEIAMDLHLPLHSIFPALKDLQLPVNLLGQIRVEIYYNNKFDEVFTIATDDTTSFALGADPAVLAGGASYAVNDTFDIKSAGSSVVNATGKVVSETTGAVSKVEITNRGTGMTVGTATTENASGSGDNNLTLTITANDLKSAISSSRKTVNFSNPLMLIDYLQYQDPMFENALRNTMNTTGIILPYRHSAYIRSNLSAVDGTGSFVDTNLQMSGKALMKVYALHRYSNNINSTKAEGVDLFKFCGKARSDALEDLETNLLVNSLLIQDRNIDTRTKAYHALNEAGENMAFAPPATLETNLTMNASADNDELSTSAIIAGNDVSSAPLSYNMKDALQGSLYITAFDLGKYPQGGDTLQNSGFRVGSTPVIFRSKRNGTTDFTKLPVECDFYVEFLKVMDIRSQVVDVRDQ